MPLIRVNKDGNAMCGVFSGCVNEASGYTDHSILGPIPACPSCCQKLDTEFVEARIEITE